MDQNNNKLLYRLIFALTFLAIFTISGLLWFYPKAEGTEGAVFVGSDEEEATPAQLFDTVDRLNNKEDYNDEEMYKLTDFPEETAEGPEGVDTDTSLNVEAEGDDGIIPADIPEEAIPVTPEEPKVEPKTEPELVPAPQPKPTVKTVRVKVYQIQVGSYTDRYRADETRRILEDKGLVATISSTEKNGTNYFRVRIGPYGNKEEAEKFLSQVKEIKGFEESYISMVYVNKQVSN